MRNNFLRYALAFFICCASCVSANTSFAQLATFNYTGPQFDLAQCQNHYSGYPPSICVANGNVTATVTAPNFTPNFSGRIYSYQGLFVAGVSTGVPLQLTTATCNSGAATFVDFNQGFPTGYLLQLFGSGCTTPGATFGVIHAQNSDSDSASTQANNIPLSAGYISSPTGRWSNAKTLGKPKDPAAPCNKREISAYSGGPSNSGTASCGDPIDIASGNVFEEVSDYSTVGANQLSFVRYYNSGASSGTVPTLMGTHWRSNFDRYITIIDASDVNVERADGRIVSFWLNGATWTTDSDINLKLTNSGATWTLTDGDDTVETYTTSGAKAILNTIKLRNGYTQTLNYTTGVVTSVSDSYSRSLGFTYTGGVLTGVTTPDSLTLTFGYTTVAAQKLLTSVTYNTSPVTSQTYLYENANFPFALTGITDEKTDRYATWSYDGYGRGTSSQHGTSTTTDGLTTISYNDSTGNRTVTGPLGVAETYVFTMLQSMNKVTEIDRAATGTTASAIRTFGYDTNGYLNASTDWNGNSTTYVNDIYGQPTTINEAVGSPVARTTTIAYDTTWPHLAKTITTPGLTITNNYEVTTGNLLTQVLADTTTQTIPYSTNGQTRTTTFTYTATGQLKTVQLPRTDVVAKTTYAYTGGTLTSITDPLSHVTTVNTYTGGGRPLTITDPNSVLTTLGYDSRLRLHTKVVTVAAGNLTTTWDYDAVGNLTKVTQPDATYLSYTYDNAHRLNKITNNGGELLPLTLDADGNVTQTLWQTSTPTTKRSQTATYDALGRRKTYVGGMSQSTGYTYDSMGNLTGVTTPLTWATTFAPDQLNRLKTVTDPYTHTTGYTYDAHDRPLTVTDPNSHVTTYIYDGFGEAISVANPDSGTTVYVYNKDGGVSSKTDAASQVTNWTYDAMDRPLTRAYPADSTLNVTYTYDQAGHGKGITQLTSVTDKAGSLSLSYDETGNITTKTRTISAVAYTTSYTYFGQRLLKTIAYPTAGWIATYAINASGYITGITATQPSVAPVNLVTSVVHLPFGPVSSFTWGNAVTHATTFDNDYRQTGLTDTGTAALQNLIYGYDADNNLKTITDSITAANTQTLGYDHMERLLTAVSGTGGYGSLSYTYDNNSNRLTSGATTYTIASTSNRLSSVGATSIGYTTTGNINAIGSNTMTYNKANQLATATVSGTASTYTYDAIGMRLKTVVGAGTPSIQSYDENGILLTETNSGVETDYVYLDGVPIAAIQPAAATISYIHADRLGTPQKATNSAKTVVWSTTYQPFGATGTITGSITQNLRLPGQHADATGYNHNGFRNYYTAYGRYLESDPIGLNGGLNTYGYAFANPSKYLDRLGLMVGDEEDFDGEIATPKLIGGSGLTGPGSAGRDLPRQPSLNPGVSSPSEIAPNTRIPVKGNCTDPKGIIAPGGKLIGEPGNGPRVRVLPGGDEAARNLFNQLSKGGTPYQSNYPGTGVNLPNGDFVGYRPVSGSGDPAVDVNIGGKNTKFHFPD